MHLVHKVLGAGTQRRKLLSPIKCSQSGLRGRFLKRHLNRGHLKNPVDLPWRDIEHSMLEEPRRVFCGEVIFPVRLRPLKQGRGFLRTGKCVFNNSKVRESGL